ncbi:MAG TPA: ATP-binding protein [Acidobacteriota bacterium]
MPKPSSPTNRAPEVALVLPMLPDIEVAAVRLAGEIGRFMRLEDNKVDEIEMALIEACINAFEHSQDPQRKVEIRFYLRPDELEIWVTDHGRGFDYSQVHPPDIESRLHSESKRGWGLKIIESLMDELVVDSQLGSGTSLRMTKKR